MIDRCKDEFVTVIIPIAREDPNDIVNHLNKLAEAGEKKIECIVVSPDIGELQYKEVLSRFFNFKIIKGADISPADAVNIGLDNSTGRIFTWLNVDDRLCEGAIERVLSVHKKHPESIIYGNARRLVHGKKCDDYPVPKVILRDHFRVGCPISQPAAWIPRAQFERLGAIRDIYSLAFDYEFWLRAYENQVGFVYENQYLADVGIREGARSFRERANVLVENILLQYEYFGRSSASALLGFWSEIFYPEFDFVSSKFDIISNARKALALIKEVAGRHNDYSALDCLEGDKRLISLQMGIAAEVDRDGKFYPGARVITLGLSNAVAIIVSSEEGRIVPEHVALIDLASSEPIPPIMLPSSKSVAFKVNPVNGDQTDRLREFQLVCSDDMELHFGGVLGLK